MDKFGVFNLINSLLSLYKTQKNDNAVQSENRETPPRDSATAPKNEEARVNSLGDRLLKTSLSHDEFVKRVEKSQKKTP